MLATAPPFDRLAAFHTVVSFGGEACIAFTACRDMLPDPAFYAECVEASFDDLRSATIGKPVAKKKAKRRKKPSTKTRPLEMAS